MGHNLLPVFHYDTPVDTKNFPEVYFDSEKKTFAVRTNTSDVIAQPIKVLTLMDGDNAGQKDKSENTIFTYSKWAKKDNLEPNNEWDGWAIDGSPLEIDGNLYLAFSGWRKNDTRHNQYIFIVQLDKNEPWRVVNGADGKPMKPVLIAAPLSLGEQAHFPNIAVNEGPEYDEETQSIEISVSGSWEDSYHLIRIKRIGSNPLDPTSWQKILTPLYDQRMGKAHGLKIKDEEGRRVRTWHCKKYAYRGWERLIEAKLEKEDESPLPTAA